MFINDKNQPTIYLLSALGAMFTISWIAPIYPGTLGYEGAVYSLNLILDSFIELFDAIKESEDTGSSLLKIFSLLFVGVHNILFVLSILLIRFKPKYAWYFSAIALSSMLYWLPIAEAWGYYLWLSSCFGLCIVSYKVFETSINKSFGQMVQSKYAFPVLIPLIFLLVIYMR